MSPTRLVARLPLRLCMAQRTHLRLILLLLVLLVDGRPDTTEDVCARQGLTNSGGCGWASASRLIWAGVLVQQCRRVTNSTWAYIKGVFERTGPFDLARALEQQAHHLE